MEDEKACASWCQAGWRPRGTARACRRCPGLAHSSRWAHAGGHAATAWRSPSANLAHCKNLRCPAPAHSADQRCAGWAQSASPPRSVRQTAPPAHRAATAGRPVPGRVSPRPERAARRVLRRSFLGKNWRRERLCRASSGAAPGRLPGRHRPVHQSRSTAWCRQSARRPAPRFRAPARSGRGDHTWRAGARGPRQSPARRTRGCRAPESPAWASQHIAAGEKSAPGQSLRPAAVSPIGTSQCRRPAPAHRRPARARAQNRGALQGAGQTTAGFSSAPLSALAERPTRLRSQP